MLLASGAIKTDPVVLGDKGRQRIVCLLGNGAGMGRLATQGNILTLLSGANDQPSKTISAIALLENGKVETTQIAVDGALLNMQNPDSHVWHYFASDLSVIRDWPMLEGIGNASNIIGGDSAALERKGADPSWKIVDDFPGAPGAPRYVMEFDGTYFVKTSDKMYDAELHELTIEAWVKLGNLSSGQQRVVGWCSQNDNEENRLSFSFDQQFLHVERGKETWTNTFSVALPAESLKGWLHLTFVCENTKDNVGSEYTIYLNGEQKGAVHHSRNLPPSAPLIIGAVPGEEDKNDGRFSKGSLLAGVRIWNRKLTHEEVSSNFKHPLPSSSGDSGLFLNATKNQPEWYMLDDGSESALLIPVDSQNKDPKPKPWDTKLKPREMVVDRTGKSVLLTYKTASMEGQQQFTATSLTTLAIRDLARIAFACGIDGLLTLNNQINIAQDFDGAFSPYFQEIFFHVPFLVANTLSAHRQFEQAQTWYRKIFDFKMSGDVFDPFRFQDLDDKDACWRLTKNQNNTGFNEVEELEKVTVSISQQKKECGPKQKLTLKCDQDGGYAKFKRGENSSEVDALSVEVVFKLHKLDESDQKIVGSASWIEKGYKGFIVGVKNHNVFCEFFDKKYNNSSLFFQSHDIKSDRWVHLVATWRKAGELKAYVNGCCIASTQASGSPLPIMDKIIVACMPTETELGKHSLSKGSEIAAITLWNVELNPGAIEKRYSPRHSDSNHWRYLPFHRHDSNTMVAMLADEQAIRAYDNDPFDPHAIARLRIGAYEKSVIMKYLDNLIAWGDDCFGKDTWESITQASNLYQRAYDLLGPKPSDGKAWLAPEIMKYSDLRDGAKAKGRQELFAAASDKHQNFKSISVQASGNAPAPIESFIGDADYFCVPENDRFTGYWTKVEDQLYKIRHCQNIKGVVRELSLFESPLNPADLVRAATAGGMALRTELNVPIPPYRFEYLLERAKGIASTVIQLGASLLGALEKQDGESLAALRAGQEAAILKLIKTTRERQLEDAKANREALSMSREAAVRRQRYYQDLLNRGLLGWEQAGLDLRVAAVAVEGDSALQNFLSAGFYLLPTIFGLADGGFNPGAAIQSSAAGFSSVAGTLSNMASSSEVIAQYQRRQQEWGQQQQAATDDIAVIDRQIAAVDIGVAIAQSELNNHIRSVEQADEVNDFLTSKFTIPELYRWMAGRLSLLYMETFKIALEMALLAQKAYQYELNKDDSYIVFDYWDSLKQGLLAGEGLMLSLHQLEKAYVEGNERRLEIEKSISLKKLLGAEFDKQKAKGEFTFELIEKLFNDDFKQH